MLHFIVLEQQTQAAAGITLHLKWSCERRLALRTRQRRTTCRCWPRNQYLCYWERAGSCQSVRHFINKLCSSVPSSRRSYLCHLRRRQSESTFTLTKRAPISLVNIDKSLTSHSVNRISFGYSDRLPTKHRGADDLRPMRVRTRFLFLVASQRKSKDWQGKSRNAKFSPFILDNPHLPTSETSWCGTDNNQC